MRLPGASGDRRAHARRDLRLMDVQRRRALDDDLHIDLRRSRTPMRLRGPRKTTSLKSVLEGRQSGTPGETPTPN